DVAHHAHNLLRLGFRVHHPENQTLPHRNLPGKEPARQRLVHENPRLAGILLGEPASALQWDAQDAQQTRRAPPVPRHREAASTLAVRTAHPTPVRSPLRTATREHRAQSIRPAESGLPPACAEAAPSTPSTQCRPRRRSPPPAGSPPEAAAAGATCPRPAPRE